MRLFILAVTLSLGLSLQAAPAVCAKKAQATVLKKFGGYFYQNGRRQRRIETTDCKTLRARAGSRYVACEVGASTGEGAGDVLFKVLLDEKCTRAFRSFLVFEE